MTCSCLCQAADEDEVEEVEHAEHDHAAHAAPGDGAADLPAGFDRPVIIHRAILGSVERMFAVLLEHTAGKW